MLAVRGLLGAGEKLARRSRPLSNPLLLVVARAGTIPIIRVQSTQFTSAAGPARYSIALACLTRNWFGIRTTNLTSGLRVRAEKSGSRPKSRVGTILVNRCELC